MVGSMAGERSLHEACAQNAKRKIAKSWKAKTWVSVVAIVNPLRLIPEPEGAC